MVGPGGRIPLILPVMDDTGSDILSVYRSDIDEMSILNSSPGFVALGWQEYASPGGRSYLPIVELTVALIDPAIADGSAYLMPFINVFAGVLEGSPQTNTTGINSRLSGRWIREVLYSATSPNGNRELYLSQKKSDLKDIPGATRGVAHRWRHDPGFLQTLNPIATMPSTAQQPVTMVKVPLAQLPQAVAWQQGLNNNLNQQGAGSNQQGTGNSN